MGKGIPERKRLAAIFASFSIIIMGTASLMESMSLDYYTVLGTLGKIGPPTIILGCIGWVIGMILDQPKKRSSKGHNNLFLSEVMKNSAVEHDEDSSIDETTEK